MEEVYSDRAVSGAKSYYAVAENIEYKKTPSRKEHFNRKKWHMKKYSVIKSYH